ncbi:MAG: lipoprotein-releasing ABC transporter permease subunit [Proteobacteria bacterium]|nr:lipoprotein-releasing ABC transporter permease subunit [Pseudomonadota bacterium]MBI3499869.1 lipoprotein-releasing ABC transporter permease subunit [Pseudomonadota bacterium]
MSAFGTFERMLALRYLRARRQEGFISVIAGFSLLGIALGVATLIVVTSVMNGFRQELLGRILGLNGHVTIYGAAAPIGDFDQVSKRLGELRGVVRAIPMVEGQAMATANGIAAGALVRGMRVGDLARSDFLGTSIRSGKLESLDEDGVSIGARLAEKLHVAVGDEIALVSPQFQTTAIGSMPRTRSYTVAAIFDVGMYEYDSIFVFMPLGAAQIFFRVPDAATGIEVTLENADLVPAMRPLLASAAGGDKRLYDWQQAYSGLFNAVQVQRNVMFLILTLIVLVAAFNIISSMIMLVKDKGHDIAILRTMGATSGSVQRVFIMSGAAVGTIGTFAGLLLGIAFARNIESIRQLLQGLTGAELFSPVIYNLSHLPAILDWSEVSQVVAMGLILSFLATLYPSWRAARMDPVEALRYE